MDICGYSTRHKELIPVEIETNLTMFATLLVNQTLERSARVFKCIAIAEKFGAKQTLTMFSSLLLIGNDGNHSTAVSCVGKPYMYGCTYAEPISDFMARREVRHTQTQSDVPL